MKITDKYTIRTAKKENGPGYWDSTQAEILLNGTKIGEYIRTYHCMFNTFVPFTQKGKEYALYSDEYVCTKVMELPSCKQVAGEEPSSFGFCPTDFYVPEEDVERGLEGQFGFVAGCVWGDDSSWKIQFLDLSKISEGKLRREARFGYIELPNHLTLSQAVDCSGYDAAETEENKYTCISIACNQHFDVDLIDVPPPKLADIGQDRMLTKEEISTLSGAFCDILSRFGDLRGMSVHELEKVKKGECTAEEALDRIVKHSKKIEDWALDQYGIVR